MSSTLDEWEEEARHYCDKSIAWIADEFPTTEAQERILALIDLVRRKDRNLTILQKAYVQDYEDDEPGYLGVINETLALTENLK